jgi:hypothetical protein
VYNDNMRDCKINIVNYKKGVIVVSEHKLGRSRKYTSAAELEKKIDGYFQELPSKKEVYINEKTGIPHIIQTPAYYASLLLHCGMTYTTALPYEKGEYDDEHNAFSKVLTRARMLCEQDLAEGGIKGVYNPKMTESALQRHHEFAQKTEAKNENVNTNIDVSDDDFIEEMKKKYLKPT